MGEPFEFAVSEVFAIRGRGTVVTGRVQRGEVRAGDALEIHGPGGTRPGVVRSVETFGRIVEVGRAGEQIGIQLHGPAAEGARPGDRITSAGAEIAGGTSTTSINSEPRPTGASAPRDHRFDLAETEYHSLRGRLDAREITPKEMDAALDKLVFELAGRYWMLGANSGRWYASEGGRWVEADPPAER